MYDVIAGGGGSELGDFLGADEVKGLLSRAQCSALRLRWVALQPFKHVLDRFNPPVC
jgi:hypothetical protein